MTLMLRDLAHAVRSLLAQPRFTGVATLTLALGVGAVTVIFSVVNGILLKPLPYPNADRLVNVWSHSQTLGYDRFPLSPDLYFLFAAQTGTFESMTTFQQRRANLTGESTPDVVDTLVTTRSYFPTIGIPVARGRHFDAVEDAPGGPLVTVMSDRAWRTRFGAREDTLGRTIHLNGQPTEVIGIASRAIDAPGTPDFYLPAQFDPENPVQGTFGWEVMGRLAAGVAPDEVPARLAPLIRSHADGLTSPTYRAFLADGAYANLVHLVKDDEVGTLERPLWILLGTVCLLLLIACANVANLFLVRAESRQQEIAVRLALGAGRGTLVRSFMAEALVLSVFGSALGIVAASAGLPVLLRQAPPTIPRLDQIAVDINVLLFAVGAAVLSALVFGLLPTMRYTRPQALAALREGGRSGTDAPARRRARHGLVVAQTAMAMVLLVGSGLLARSFSRLMSTDLGFNPNEVITFRIALPNSQYASDDVKLAFHGRLVSGLQSLPGVDSVGLASEVPVANAAPGTAHIIEDRPITSGELPPIVHFKTVGPGYFDTMRIPVLSGRQFRSDDSDASATAVIVNQALADHYWPGQDPIGKRLRAGGGDGDGTTTPPWFSVVGVVGTERQDGLRMPPRPLLYYAGRTPGGGAVPNVFTYVIRGRNLDARGDGIRQAVWAVDPGLPVASLRTMQSIVDGSLVQFTFTMSTLGIAAVMALLLGSIGLYGVLSYAVTLRTREIGVRLALGATPAVVQRSVVASGAVLAAAGLALGLLGAAGLTRVMQGLLFETAPLDPATFLAMSIVLLLVALMAAYLPARRAARVSPLESMKAQ